MSGQEERSAARERRDYLYGGSDPLLDRPKFFCARCLKGFVVYDIYLDHLQNTDIQPGKVRYDTMDTENAINPAGTPVSVTDGRATFTLEETGEISCHYADGLYGFWKSYDDMMADRDLATKLGRKIRRRG